MAGGGKNREVCGGCVGNVRGKRGEGGGGRERSEDGSQRSAGRERREIRGQRGREEVRGLESVKQKYLYNAKRLAYITVRQ
jgi:hypothetical protein